MFEPTRHAAARGNPLIKAGVGVAMALGVIVAVAMASHEPSRPAPPAAADTAGGRLSLELLSMRHARDGGTLTVTGLVRNPQAAREVYGVTAVVLAFGRDGGYLASGRADLADPVLHPGEQSAFAVSIPGARDVARYRVSFRTERGVVHHTDRRAAARLAASDGI
jgi:hypothetical protein